MKHFFFFLFSGFVSLGFSQLNSARVEREDGVYLRSYHKNGKLSTEEFVPNSSSYAVQGYATAFNPNGEQIYHVVTSRTGLLSGVYFTYYENGAVSRAQYSSHPDAGIQWYQKTTYFDENGNVTGEFELSNDMHVTTLQIAPDSTADRMNRERLIWEKNQREASQRQLKEQESKDSTAFYSQATKSEKGDTLITHQAFPEAGYRETYWYKNGRLVQSTREFYKVTNGVQRIHKTYYKNGSVQEERLEENGVFHVRNFNKHGRLIREEYNLTY